MKSQANCFSTTVRRSHLFNHKKERIESTGLLVFPLQTTMLANKRLQLGKEKRKRGQSKRGIKYESQKGDKMQENRLSYSTTSGYIYAVSCRLPLGHSLTFSYLILFMVKVDRITDKTSNMTHFPRKYSNFVENIH